VIYPTAQPNLIGYEPLRIMETQKDDFATVPVLEPDGSNWVVWKTRVEFAMAAKGTFGHLDNTVPRPTEAEPLKKWQEKEFLARWQLTRAIKDVTLQKIVTKSAVHEMWTAIKTEFETKSALVQADLRAKFSSIRCPEKGDVRAHLDDIRTANAQLASVGVKIEDSEYSSTIMKSLPRSYANHLSSLSAAARMMGKTLDPNSIMMYVLEEYERQRILEQPKPEKAKETAFATQPGPSGGGWKTVKGGKGGKPNVEPKANSKPFGGECFNCHGIGHRARDCPSPKQDKPSGSSGNGKQKESANPSEVVDGIWTAIFEDHPENPPIDDTDFADMPDLQSGDDSDSDSEDEMPDLKQCDSSDDESIWLSEGDESGYDLLDDESDEDWDVISIVDDVAAPATHPPEQERSELYDSGATKHMSPYRDEFTTIRETLPKPVNAANQQTFNATGIGEMVIEVPNGINPSKLRLTEVLYSPEIGFTLVSIGRIDDAGYSANFANGQCEIRSGEGEVLGRIPKTKGLYKVVRESPNEAHFASPSQQRLTVMELHRRMGHISPDAAKRLVEKGFVTGVNLDLSSTESNFCESCVHAKSKRSPIRKVREGEGQRNLERKSTLTCGDHRQSNRSTANTTMSRLPTTTREIRTSTSFERNLRHSTLTNSLKPGRKLT
jgi:hypothetical protein